MECRLLQEHARALDRVLNQYTAKNITLSTLGKITLQTKSENSSLYTNVVLPEGFFLELSVGSPVTVEFQKLKFYYQEMEYLDIRLERHFVELFWKFKDHTFSKTICVSYTHLKSIDFEFYEAFDVQKALLQEIIRNIHHAEITFGLNEQMVFHGLGSSHGTKMQMENRTRVRNLHFSVQRRILKTIAESGFEKYEFMVDKEERRLCVFGELSGLFVSYLTACHIE